MPCIHLMPHYRERFGFAEGQFPVAEDASARLLALPFFGSMGEEQVERVCRGQLAQGARLRSAPSGPSQRTVSRMPSSQGLNSTPSSDRALELSARACQRRKVSWPEPRSGGRRITRESASPPAASPRASGTGMAGGTHPRPASSTATVSISRMVA